MGFNGTKKCHKIKARPLRFIYEFIVIIKKSKRTN